ncbi:MAG: hypothetical protein QM765_41660 [Myxococcales bacterium]
MESSSEAPKYRIALDQPRDDPHEAVEPHDGLGLHEALGLLLEALPRDGGSFEVASGLDAAHEQKHRVRLRLGVEDEPGRGLDFLDVLLEGHVVDVHPDEPFALVLNPLQHRVTLAPPG